MEAKSLLNMISRKMSNLYKPTFYAHISGAECGVRRGVFCDELDKIYKFYSTPFNKEMVCDLFKYWMESEIKNEYINLNDNGISFGKNLYEIRLDKEDSLTGDKFLMPKTLDDFIRDCERKGLMLVWKDGITGKFFKNWSA